MNDLVDILAQITQLFESRGLEYVLMGGMAVRAHGIPRATYDLDFTVTIAHSDLPGLFSELRDLGYTVPESYDRGWRDQVGGMPLFKCERYVGGHALAVDVFLTETPFQTSYQKRRLRVEADGIPLWIVTPEDLILLKLLAGRPRDYSDVYDIVFMQAQLDLVYLRAWADRLAIRDALERVLIEPPQI